MYYIKTEIMKTLKTFFYLFIIGVVLTSCFGENDSYVRTTDVVPITEVSIPDSSGISDTIQIAATAQADRKSTRLNSSHYS